MVHRHAAHALGVVVYLECDGPPTRQRLAIKPDSWGIDLLPSSVRPNRERSLTMTCVSVCWSTTIVAARVRLNPICESVSLKPARQITHPMRVVHSHVFGFPKLSPGVEGVEEAYDVDLGLERDDSYSEHVGRVDHCR